MKNPYQPYLAKIIGIIPQTEDTKLFQIRFEDEKVRQEFNHRPGQFVMLSVLGTGEAPISISSSPTKPGIIELCVRCAGSVTGALFKLKENDIIGLRGPYGNGYFIEKIKGSNLLIVAGGIGIAPLRSLVWYTLDNRNDFKDIALMYGAKNPDEILFKDEFVSLLNRKDIKCLLTVDKDESGKWKSNIGVVTELFNYVNFDAKTTYAGICGPPIMYKFVLKKLISIGFDKDKIMMSLERRMQCGIGKCLHCGVGHKYTCTDGPIFTYWDAINMPEVV
ncbi:MAG: FAD/NAD(P)-binding protein [Elusimicrobiota bacterium]